MIGIAHIRSFRPDAVWDLAHALDVERQRLLLVVELVLWRRVVGVAWSGPASVAAAAHTADVVGLLASIASRVALSSDALRTAVPTMRVAAQLLGEADRRAQRGGGLLTREGLLLMPIRTPTGDPVADANVARDDRLTVSEVEQLLHRTEQVAREADDRLARDLLLASLSMHLPAPTAARVEPRPPPVLAGADRSAAEAFASAAWWRSLTPLEQRSAIAEHPEWVGPRDGVPAWARHEANLVLLLRAEQRVEERVRSARAVLQLPSPGRWLPGRPVAQQLRHAEQHRDDLRAVRDVLARADGGRRTLLLVDDSGGLLRTAVAVGDVDRAEHVVTFVGGMSTRAADLGRYDELFARMRSDARRIAADDDVAIVTWMGYEAPQTDELLSLRRSVLSDRVARTNADELASFVTGVEAARDRPAHQTIWGHSYGSVVGGFALLQAMPADDVVVFGSPGLPVTRIEQLGLKPGGLNVLATAGDYVAFAGPLVHGTAANEVLGSTWLATVPPKAEANVWRESRGHSDYLSASTISAHNLLAVALARSDLRRGVTPAERERHARYHGKWAVM